MRSQIKDELFPLEPLCPLNETGQPEGRGGAEELHFVRRKHAARNPKNGAACSDGRKRMKRCALLLICLLLCFAASCGAEEEMPELRIGVTVYAPFFIAMRTGSLRESIWNWRRRPARG